MTESIKRKDTPENRAYWNHVEQVAADVRAGRPSGSSSSLQPGLPTEPTNVMEVDHADRTGKAGPPPASTPAPVLQPGLPTAELLAAARRDVALLRTAAKLPLIAARYEALIDALAAPDPRGEPRT